MRIVTKGSVENTREKDSLARSNGSDIDKHVLGQRRREKSNMCVHGTPAIDNKLCEVNIIRSVKKSFNVNRSGR